ncbi:VOC family protein [Desertibaculum subflavum]|uniref:VOC family protein n=1 Tax=Desertibaculum subflavum TaxID=2268458 RepID=UPI000E674B31
MPNVTPSKIRPCLWFADDAEAAARFYVSLFPDSRIDHVHHALADTPGGKAGSVLFVEFTLAGQKFQALNGGQKMEYTLAVSLSVECEDQEEVDRLWDAILQGGGEAQQCGWIKDRWGLPWQIVPRVMLELLADPDRAKAGRAFQAMLGMVKLDIAALERAAAGK